MPETKERGLVVDQREARGLADGSISVLVRVVDPPPEGNPCEVMWNTCINEWVPWAWISSTRHGWSRCGPSIRCPFGPRGTKQRAVAEPGEPCEHRGCLSHVTHVCEGCGRGWAGIAIVTKDVRVCRVQKVTAEEAKAFGVRWDGTYWLGGIHPIKGSLQCWPTPQEAVLAFLEPDSDKRGRGANPWVFVGTVEKIDANATGQPNTAPIDSQRVSGASGGISAGSSENG